MSEKDTAILNRWKARALRAENKLRLAGLKGGESVAGWSDDEYLVLCLEHKDGSTATVDELQAAQARLNIKG
ncbi:TPA: hypothetical protein ACSCXL_004125 [Aeromonas veronii]|uniref:hypothetical protein n=1 Tax=Aeromonas TaxID=642 RepID=UPI0022304372|nr:hypothetical protein [Aeromonas veronii]UZE61663.1 hypothetical protein ONR73_10915 [Aeromonas veronii]